MTGLRLPYGITSIARYTAVIIIMWSLVVALSLLWNANEERNESLARARKEALVTFNKDQAFRQWATKHGGVYVPATDQTPPNPYLSHVPDRDITLPDGKRLTLMNPAYALKQIMQDFAQAYGTKGHITSLKPLNPANAPDDWERAALQQFEQGAEEVSEVTAVNGRDYLRLMRQMITQKGCLKCHAAQGYKEGDVRGGVSVSIPLETFQIAEQKVVKNLLITHAAIWLLGVGGIGFVYSRSKRNIIERTAAEEKMRESRDRFLNLVESTNDFVWEVDHQGRWTYVSQKIADILGYEPAEVLGTPSFDRVPAGESRTMAGIFNPVSGPPQPFSCVESVNLHKQGQHVILECSGAPFYDAEGNLRGYRGIARDITQRRRTEGENRKLREFFENVAESIVTGVWVADREDVIFYANRAVTMMTDIAPTRFIGTSVLRDFPEQIASVISPFYLRARELMKPVRYDALRFITPLGRESFQSGWMIPRMRGGRYDGMICTVEDVTERTRAEERIVRVVAAIPDLLFVISREGAFVNFHAPSVDDLYVPPERIIGGNIRDFFDPGLSDQISRHIGMVLETRKPITFSYSLPMPPGIRFYEAKMAVYSEDEVIVVSRDMTESKKSERSLALMNFALNNVREQAFLIDEQARFQYVNDESCRALGYGPEELLRLGVSDVDSDFPPERWHDHWSALMAQGSLMFESRHRTKDGATFPVEVSANYFEYDGRGYNLALARDITDRKRSEAEIRRSNELLERVFSVSHTLIAYMDREFNFIRVNNTYAAADNRQPEFFRGKNHFDLYPNAENEEIFRTVIRTGNPYIVFEKPFEYTEHPERGVSYWDWTLQPVKDPSGAVEGLVLILRDVTERKRATIEKEKLEQQLRHAQKMESIGTLAGGVAHDFNNILTTIIGYANVAKMKMKPGDALHGPIDSILSSAERAANLTGSLLAFSRKQVIHPKPVNINMIVRGVEKLLRHLIGEDVDLSTRLDDSNPVIMADTGQIEQVLLNLATNARDAMPHGGTIAITTQAMDLEEDFVKRHGFGKPGRYALVSVSDTGTGMDTETKEKIFEPFFTTKETSRGTGLGLAIVYGIVKQHNGSISVYSQPGKGTTFNIYIPVVFVPGEERPAAASELPRGGTETILLAEDDRDVKDIVGSILQDFGYRVIDAANGQEAIDRYRERSSDIDLVILDVIMPKKSGREVYDVVKSINPSASVLFTSGYTADIINMKGIFEEGFQFLSKPISPVNLLQKIREILDSEQGAVEPPRS